MLVSVLRRIGTIKYRLVTNEYWPSISPRSVAVSAVRPSSRPVEHWCHNLHSVSALNIVQLALINNAVAQIERKFSILRQRRARSVRQNSSRWLQLFWVRVGWCFRRGYVLLYYILYEVLLILVIAAKDFISKLLVLDPKKRLTTEQCLNHPWLKKAPY